VSEIRGDLQEILERLTRPYFEQGAEEVFVSKCCGRVFVGTGKPQKCRSCTRKPPAFVAFSSQKEVSAARLPEQEPLA